MLVLDYLPLKYRLPLIHRGLGLLARLRCGGWARADAAHLPVPGKVMLSGFLNESLGVGEGARLSLQALRAAGYTVTALDLRPCIRHVLDSGRDLPNTAGVWFIHANAPEVLVALLAHRPEQWARTYRIAYWAWETPKAPASWVFVADYLHEIWLPSRFVHDAVALTFREAGRPDLLSRLRIMPHPVPVPRSPLERRDSPVCRVLCLFDTKSSAVRKNPWAVIEAWRTAFPQASDRARLTLKVSALSQDPVTAARLASEIGDRSDIALVSDHFTAADMAAFIAGFDILISLHRAEGFGLTLAEAMAAGAVVIATGWSGNLDFMTDADSRLVPAHLVAVRDPEGPYSGLNHDPQQQWAEPDIAAAAEALRDLAASLDLRRSLAEAARRNVEALTIPWRRDALRALPFNAYVQTM